MKTLVLFITLLGAVRFGAAQGIAFRLQESVRKLESDDQLKSGLIGICVIDQKTGKPVFERNAQTGLPVASSQKVLISVAALELLGGSYRYQTNVGYTGNIQNGILNGGIRITGSGDPTLGSWRYDNTNDQVVLGRWMKAIREAGIKQVNGEIEVNNTWETQTTPGGWIWDDIGNYYGAGVMSVNWRENQYDLKLRSGARTGDSVKIVTTVPKLYEVVLINELLAGKPGSGDNAYIYLPPYAREGYIRGTIPPGENAFTVSGSFPDPARQLKNLVRDELLTRGIILQEKTFVGKNTVPVKELASHFSPSLDSMNYWFLRKSINLYGEAFAKTLGNEKAKSPSTKAGITVIKNFWKERGIDTTSINICDGSGLSPQNRVTAEALAKAVQYARSQPYFRSFYNALPEFNGIKMKSGTISGVKSFTGYVGGYSFAIVVSNYNGSTGEVVKKMYRLLDVLK